MLRMLFLIILSRASHAIHWKTEKRSAEFIPESKRAYSSNKLRNFGDYTNSAMESEQQNKTWDSLPAGFVSYHFNPYYHMQASAHEEGFDRKRDNSKTHKMVNLNVTNSHFIDELRTVSSFRRKRHISKRLFVHNSDGKYLITGYYRRQFPYSNVVRLSSGCTGTLLTPAHVLTAAHCVHDGKDFKENIEMLKIEVPDKIGFRLHYITAIKVSIKWIKSQKLPEVARGAYDYAILQLNLPVRDRTKFLQLEVPDINKLSSDIHFLGFFSSVSSGMWKSTCSTDDSLVLMRRNIVLTECDSATGNSGAAVFTDNARDGRKIIGVLSNIVSASDDEEETHYSSIMLLTLSKSLDICAMIYPEAEKYDICTIVKKQNMKHLAGPKRIMSFFGK